MFLKRSRLVWEGVGIIVTLLALFYYGPRILTPLRSAKATGIIFVVLVAICLYGKRRSLPFHPIEPILVSVGLVLGLWLPILTETAPGHDISTLIPIPQHGEMRKNFKDGQMYVYIPHGRFEMGCSPSDTEC